jgi:hypothetical protein
MRFTLESWGEPQGDPAQRPIPDRTAIERWEDEGGHVPRYEPSSTCSRRLSVEQAKMAPAPRAQQQA